jgi:predicted metal-dependent peptidase
MYLKFVSVPKMRKISTNGRCIYFNPDFIEKLYDCELDYILVHQILHILYGHIWCQRDVSGDNYHFARDIYINLLLENTEFCVDRYPHLGYLYRQISDSIDFRGKTPEEISELMPYSLYLFNEPTRNKFLIDTDDFWDKKDDNGKLGEIILDLPEIEGKLQSGKSKKKISADSGDGDGDEDNNSEEGENQVDSNLMQEWQVRAAFMANSIEMADDENKGAGDVPDFVKRMIDKMKKPRIDWKKILNDFVQERINDYSFSPPDRRFNDLEFFLPDFNEKDFVSKEILFMVDTSGSIKDEELAVVYSEIKGAIEHFGNKLTGKLGFFDVGVTEPVPFYNVDDLTKIIPIGGGGTNFNAIFDYVKYCCNDELPACIVIFTDGEALYPPESVTMGIPVLWMINNFDITPPWGRVTRVFPYEFYEE